MASTKDNSPANSIEVGSVAEEYAIISRQRCDCGGAFRVERQQLLTQDDDHYDLIETRCERCHHSRSFLFDISSFFDEDQV